MGQGLASPRFVYGPAEEAIIAEERIDRLVDGSGTPSKPLCRWSPSSGSTRLGLGRVEWLHTGDLPYSIPATKVEPVKSGKARKHNQGAPAVLDLS